MLQVSFRFAQVDDLDGVIALLNQDHLGKTRESLSEKVLGQYQQAFKEILNSPYFDVLLMEEVITHELLGCAQLMYLPHLSFKGSTRMQVESVRVEEKFRGKGLGKN